jgi:LAO/AO transport system kinase
MKAGLLEMAHIIVVNKGDRPGAEATLLELRDWFPTVIRTIAATGEQVPDLISAITTHQRLRDLGCDSAKFRSWGARKP